VREVLSFRCICCGTCGAVAAPHNSPDRILRPLKRQADV
jgi:hypothetical protein